MKKISAVIVGDSVSPTGDRITSILMTFPRCILAELNTHRMFARNSASSRAIPFKKMVETVKNDPFIPIAWQKDHKGMQGSEYIEDYNLKFCQVQWLKARDFAVNQAVALNEIDVTKQICNRLLEPFMWHTALVTATEWENFFEQRCPQYESTDSEKIHYFRSKKDWLNYHKGHVEGGSTFDDMFWFHINKGQAEIHMMTLAEAVWDAMNESQPVQLNAGEWHIPFGDKITEEDFEYYLGDKGQSQDELISNLVGSGAFTESELTNEYLSYNYKWSDKYNVWLTKKMINFDESEYNQFKISVSVAMCARTSYTTIGEEKEISYENLIAIHDRMKDSRPIHYSPFEHCARVMSPEEYNAFIKGKFDINYADMVSDDYKTVDGGSNTSSFGWCDNYKGFISYRHMIQHQY